MTRRQNHPLRELTAEERQELERVSRASSESAARVARGKALLAVAQGHRYTAAAQASGRRFGDAVSQLVERFNQEGLAALTPRHGGGAKTAYGPGQRQQIVELAQQGPNLETDGVSQWSLSTLQRRLRAQADSRDIVKSGLQQEVKRRPAADLSSGYLPRSVAHL